MLTPEEKKEIREIADNVYPYPYGDKEIERQYCTEGMAIEREADAYGKGMEDGILQERERILQIFSNCETVHHVEINQPSGSFIFNSLKNKVTNKSK